MAAANLHVTLAFLGAVPQGRLPNLIEVARGSSAVLAGAVASRRALTFDRLEYWRSAEVLCALPSEPPEWAAALARMIQELLTEGGFAPDFTISPFRPHVTVARKVNRSTRAIDIEPVTWTCSDFVLVDSKTRSDGAVYTVLERFLLEQ